MSSVNKQYKVVILGNAGVGKTTYINRHKTGEFEKRYLATNGSCVKDLIFNTNKGEIRFETWDLGGQDKYSFGPNFDNLYFIGADCAIIFFDVTSKVSYTDVKFWYGVLVERCPNIPIVLCGNKVDCKDRKVKPSDITFPRENKLQYYDISAKSNYNFEKPFLYLMRKIYGEDANFVEMPALLPPAVTLEDISKQLAMFYQNENRMKEETKENTIAEQEKSFLDDGPEEFMYKLNLFIKGSDLDISLKSAIQVIKDEELWKKWLALYKTKKADQTIFRFLYKENGDFYVA